MAAVIQRLYLADWLTATDTKGAKLFQNWAGKFKPVPRKKAKQMLQDEPDMIAALTDTQKHGKVWLLLHGGPGTELK